MQVDDICDILLWAVAAETVDGRKPASDGLSSLEPTAPIAIASVPLLHDGPPTLLAIADGVVE